MTLSDPDPYQCRQPDPNKNGLVRIRNSFFKILPESGFLPHGQDTDSLTKYNDPHRGIYYGGGGGGVFGMAAGGKIKKKTREKMKKEKGEMKICLKKRVKCPNIKSFFGKEAA